MPVKRPYGWGPPGHYNEMIPQEGIVDESELILGEFEGRQAVNEVRPASWSSFVATMEAGATAGNPRAGIFSIIGNRAAGGQDPAATGWLMRVFCHPHDGSVRDLGAMVVVRPEDARAAQMPPEIAWTEYGNHPRDLVFFCWSAPAFVVYADRTLLGTEATMAPILNAFGLEPPQCLLRSDEHYRTVP